MDILVVVEIAVVYKEVERARVSTSRSIHSRIKTKTCFYFYFFILVLTFLTLLIHSTSLTSLWWQRERREREKDFNACLMVCLFWLLPRKGAFLQSSARVTQYPMYISASMINPNQQHRHTYTEIEKERERKKERTQSP